MTNKWITSRMAQVGFLVVAAVLCAIYVHPMAGLAPLVPLAFGALSQSALSDIGRALAAWGLYDPSGGPVTRTIAKTADYAILDPFTATTGGDPSGTIFTNRGAVGAVVFTLPAVLPRLKGVFYDFLGVADQTFTVAAAATTVVTFNNAAATSVACSTGGKKIGNHIRAYCDGTSWILNGDTVGGAYTVA